jgi:hypothetical protein
MYEEEKLLSDYKEMEEALLPFGFKQIDPGVFEHSVMRRTFDFSASSMAGTMAIIFGDGARAGEESAKANIREAIGVY